ncbi:MAG: YHS domain-containing protein, partial [Acidobacteria bacterium]|nr:YHS domain-containing protein [Acidobacteriota bacterium]
MPFPDSRGKGEAMSGCCGTEQATKQETSIDPICGMTVDPATSKHHAEYRGVTYHFCCDGCRQRFESDPEKALRKEEAPSCCAGHGHPEAAPPAGRGPYICPMCPEVLEEEPVPCPKCGMALEP